MALINFVLYCSKAGIRVPVVVGWWGGVGGGVVQTDFRVKPTTKLLWVAFGLGCCCLAWLWGYDNSNQHDVLKVVESFSNNNWIHMEVIAKLSSSWLV